MARVFVVSQVEEIFGKITENARLAWSPLVDTGCNNSENLTCVLFDLVLQVLFTVIIAERLIAERLSARLMIAH